jgi:hypothetical protein
VVYTSHLRGLPIPAPLPFRCCYCVVVVVIFFSIFCISGHLNLCVSVVFLCYVGFFVVYSVVISVMVTTWCLDPMDSASTLCNLHWWPRFLACVSRLNRPASSEALPPRTFIHYVLGCPILINVVSFSRIYIYKKKIKSKKI